jgi:uncharacterized protein (TIGR02147 family)
MSISAQIKVLLLNEFENIRCKNPNYSLRAFAQKLAVPPSALSEVMNGDRVPAEKLALKILLGLNLEPSFVNKTITNLSAERRGVEYSEDVGEYKTLDAEYFHVIADWYHFAILSLAETKGFKSNARWISRRLGISEVVAEKAIERLIKLEMLSQDKDGKLKATGIQYKSTTDIVSQAIKKQHTQNLDMAKEALEQIDINMRDITSITMAIDLKLLPEAKKKIQKFRREMSSYLESGSQTEVYKLNVQLFPISHPGIV